VPMIPSSLLPSRLGGYGQRELTSVVIPGTLLLIELWLMIFGPEEAFTPAEPGKQGGYLQLASDQIKDTNDWILAVALFLAVLAAYTLGLLGRMSAWFLFDFLRCKPLPIFDLFRRKRFPNGPEVRSRFEAEHGPEEVERALAPHPALRNALDKKDHDPFFQYAKLWLRHRRPQLAVEHHEAEINFLIAIQVPLFFAAFVALRQAGLVWFFVALSAALVLIGILFLKALNRSRDETFDVMRNFLFAQWYGEAGGAQTRSAPTPQALEAD
jgi:hypothetical protein